MILKFQKITIFKAQKYKKHIYSNDDGPLYESILSYEYY